MRYLDKRHAIWSFGLDEAALAALHEHCGPLCHIRIWNNTLADAAALSADPPCMICFSREGFGAFSALPSAATAHLELVPKALFADSPVAPAGCEDPLDVGFCALARPPYTAARMEPVLRKAAETAALHQDVMRMTREIGLGRELLESKTDALDFLIAFLRDVSAQGNEAAALRAVFAGLRRLFPVLSLHAVLTSENDGGGINADLYIAGYAEQPSWRALLLDAAAGLHPGRTLVPTSMALPLSERAVAPSLPTDGHILTLPLARGRDTLGVVIVLTDMEENLNRDQVQALDAAMGHLTLVLQSIHRHRQTVSDVMMPPAQARPVRAGGRRETV